MKKVDTNYPAEYPVKNPVGKTIPLVLTVPEAAKELRIGSNRCYELVRCGRLRSIKVGKKYLIPGPAILEFLGMDKETPA